MSTKVVAKLVYFKIGPSTHLSYEDDFDDSELDVIAEFDIGGTRPIPPLCMGGRGISMTFDDEFFDTCKCEHVGVETVSGDMKGSDSKIVMTYYISCKKY